MGDMWWLGPLVASGACAGLVYATRACHSRWTADHLKGVQKLHQGNPPRVGLLPIWAGALAGWAVLAQGASPAAQQASQLLGWLLLCGLPAAGLGLLEDITKKVRARWRLLGPSLGVCLAAWLLGAVIPRVGIPGVDAWVAWAPLGLVVTLLMVVGFTHAMNIVDGLNGLASGLALLMLAATGLVAYQLGDVALAQVCAVLACAVAGFMLLNFPRGLMFLGDGGAYFLGFTLAVLWVLLLVSHPEGASPWFVMAVAFHATMETIFSIVRRKFRRRPKNATAPDRLHFHTLVLRRRVRARWLPVARRSQRPWLPNAVASTRVLACAVVPVLLAMVWPASDVWGAAVCGVGVLLYLGAYRRMVRFGRLRLPGSPVRGTGAAAVQRAAAAKAANDSVVPGTEPARASGKL